MVTIIYVIDQLNTGGAERQLLELVRHLDRDLFSPIVCSVWGKLGLAENFHDANIKILPFHKRSRWDFKFLIDLVKYIRQHKIHIVQTIMPTANMWGRAAAILAGAPILIASERAVRSDDPTVRVLLDNCLAQFTDAFIVNSKVGAVQWEKLLRKKPGTFSVINNGVDMLRFSSKINDEEKSISVTKLGLNPNSQIVGVIARLSPEKDPATFLKAAAQINKIKPDVQFIWVGDGPIRVETEVMAQSVGLEDIVLFLGERNDVPQLLMLMDLLVLSSAWEGLPNVIIEAMASGKPVVATDVGGVHELVQDGVTGFLVPPGRPIILAEKVLQILNDEILGKQMGMAGKRYAKEHFSLEKMVSTTQDLYRQLLFEKDLLISDKQLKVDIKNYE